MSSEVLIWRMPLDRSLAFEMPDCTYGGLNEYLDACILYVCKYVRWFQFSLLKWVSQFLLTLTPHVLVNNQTQINGSVSHLHHTKYATAFIISRGFVRVLDCKTWSRFINAAQIYRKSNRPRTTSTSGYGFHRPWLCRRSTRDHDSRWSPIVRSHLIRLCLRIELIL